MSRRSEAVSGADALSATVAVAIHDFYKSNGTKSSDHAFFCEGPSMTRQEFAEECDINTIMRRYENTGVSINGLTPPPGHVPMYVDWSSLPGSLLEYQTFMASAASSFMTLPASVRKQFDNDPIAFCDFASAPENLEQMRLWGLAPKPAPAAPPSVPTGAPLAAPPGSPSPGGAAS